MIITTLFASYAILFSNDSIQSGIILSPYYYSKEQCEFIGTKAVKRYQDSSTMDKAAAIRYQCIPDNSSVNYEMKEDAKQ